MSANGTTKKVGICDTTLRDGHQSLLATRFTTEDILKIAPAMDDIGFSSVEVWGGATFDTCLRFLREDPWDRLRKIRKAMPKTKLQMLLRGQNLLGYKHYPDDVVRTFVAKSIENGIDVIRIFDALNDLRNLEVSVKETVLRKGIAQVAISYTTSPVHTLDNYVKLIKEIESMGATTLCIKDMAGVMSPKECYDLVKAIKENSRLPLHVHTHSTTGLAFMTYLKAAEAGADVIDTALSSFSGGTSQPATETLAYALAQMGYQTGLKADVLKEANDYFRPIRDEYIKSGLMDALVMGTETDALNYQIPGGMLSNLVSQLKAQNAMDKFHAVLEETPRVRKDLGYPPLVTPMSQMVGVQAVANVLSGERYKNVSKEVRSYLRGEYGQAPGAVDADVLKKVLGDEKPVTGRFASTLGDGMAQGKKEAGPLAGCTEDVLSYIVFPTVADKFFAEREERRQNRAKYTIVKV